METLIFCAVTSDFLIFSGTKEREHWSQTLATERQIDMLGRITKTNKIVSEFPFYFNCEEIFTKEFYLVKMTKNSFLYSLQRVKISDLTFAEVFDDS